MNELPKQDKIFLRVAGTLFCVGGLIHWFIIFGFIEENNPTLVSWYFHSLAVFSIVAGIGLLKFKKWGIRLTLLICSTQIPVQLYMLYLDAFQNWNSGFGIPERLIDILLVSFCLIYILSRKNLRSFSSRK